MISFNPHFNQLVDMELLKQLTDNNIIIFPDFGTWPTASREYEPVKALLERNSGEDPIGEKPYKIHIFRMNGEPRIVYHVNDKMLQHLLDERELKEKPYIRSKYPEMENAEETEEDSVWMDDFVGDVFDIGEKIEALIAREYKKIETKYLKKKVPLGKIRNAFLAEFRDMPISPPEFPIQF